MQLQERREGESCTLFISNAHISLDKKLSIFGPFLNDFLSLPSGALQGDLVSHCLLGRRMLVGLWCMGAIEHDGRQMLRAKDRNFLSKTFTHCSIFLLHLSRDKTDVGMPLSLFRRAIGGLSFFLSFGGAGG